MPKDISVGELAGLLKSDGGSFALIDVRETVEYNLAHIAGACSVPRRQLEFRLQELVPFAGTRVVVCDDDGRRAELAAATIASMKYSDVSVLSGGLNRWVTEDQPTEWGVNVASKDFGEKALIQQGIPEISPDELNQRIQRGDKLIILDSRTPEEHQRACIPGSRSMPGAELGLRTWDLLEPDATVIVHCAGRTRSIIGAGTLVRMGLDNVFALKNGTMGWQLAGLTLENGSTRLELPSPSEEGLARAEETARRVASEEGVRYVDADEARSLLATAGTQNVYALDVRSQQEYAASHIPGFRWAPGGQVVQATDSYIAVRDGVILLTCDGIVRSSMTASWLRQMGHANVYVLEGGTKAWEATGARLEPGIPDSQPWGYEAAERRRTNMTASTLRDRLHMTSAPKVIHVGSSDEFSEGHVPGSVWIPRGWLELRIGEVIPAKETRIVVSCPDGVQSTLAARTLQSIGYGNTSVLEGGVANWRAMGLAMERGLTGVTQAPDDVLPGRRSYAEMLNYLRWEEELGRKYETSPPGPLSSNRGEGERERGSST